MTDLLRAALDVPGYAPLPSRARELLETLGAPPRLGAHLRVVHDVALSLTGWAAGRTSFDAAAVLFGAATHDIGKVRHPADKVWKAKRVPELEERVVSWLGGPAWETFMALDDELSRIASEADSRLAFQGSYPTDG